MSAERNSSRNGVCGHRRGRRSAPAGDGRACSTHATAATRTTELSLTCVTKWCRKRSRRSAFVSASGAFERRETCPGLSSDARRRRPGESGPVLDTSWSLRVSEDCVVVSVAGLRLFCRNRSLIVPLEGGCGGCGAAGSRPAPASARSPLALIGRGSRGDRAVRRTIRGSRTTQPGPPAVPAARKPPHQRSSPAALQTQRSSDPARRAPTRLVAWVLLHRRQRAQLPHAAALAL